MKKYLVATASGGIMECPEFTYSLYDIIEAESKKEACKTYNKKHKCSYFYGAVICEIEKETLVNIGEDYSVRQAKEGYSEAMANPPEPYVAPKEILCNGRKLYKTITNVLNSGSYNIDLTITKCKVCKNYHINDKSVKRVMFKNESGKRFGIEQQFKFKIYPIVKVGDAFKNHFKISGKFVESFTTKVEAMKRMKMLIDQNKQSYCISSSNLEIGTII